MMELYTEEILSEEDEKAIYGEPVLDSNQQAAYDRLVGRILVRSIDSDVSGELQAAADLAIESTPTIREAVEGVLNLRFGPAYCYLAFYGTAGSAAYLKVGMSRHPEERLYSMSTGNPLDCLWVYVCELPSTRAAYHVEQQILRHMASHKRRGEWISLGAIDSGAAASLARSMAELAKSAEPKAGEFRLLSYRDGRGIE